MAIADYIYNDSRRLFEQEGSRFDTGEFMEYVANHDYNTDYDSLKIGFIRKKIAERRNCAASPRDYMDGYVPDVRSEDISSASQDESTTVP